MRGSGAPVDELGRLSVGVTRLALGTRAFTECRSDEHSSGRWLSRHARHCCAFQRVAAGDRRDLAQLSFHSRTLACVLGRVLITFRCVTVR